mgnify:CR=1 FL=1
MRFSLLLSSFWLSVNKVFQGVIISSHFLICHLDLFPACYSFIKNSLTAVGDPKTANFLTINVSSSLVKGEAFQQDIFIGENSRNTEENQLVDFRLGLTTEKESADVSWLFRWNGEVLWLWYCLIFLSTYWFSYILRPFIFVIPNRNTL